MEEREQTSEAVSGDKEQQPGWAAPEMGQWEPGRACERGQQE